MCSPEISLIHSGRGHWLTKCFLCTPTHHDLEFLGINRMSPLLFRMKLLSTAPNHFLGVGRGGGATHGLTLLEKMIQQYFSYHSAERSPNVFFSLPDSPENLDEQIKEVSQQVLERQTYFSAGSGEASIHLSRF